MNGSDLLVNVLATTGLTVGAVLLLMRLYVPRLMNSVLGNAAEQMKTGYFSQLGQRSGEARLEKGLERAAASDAISLANPALNMILGAMPSVKRWVLQDPETRVPLALGLAERFMPQIQGMLAGQSSQGQDTIAKRIKEMAQ